MSDPVGRPPADVRWSAIAEHRDHLLRIARRRLPSRQDAEDCVHEAMVRCAAMEDLDPDRARNMLTAVTMRICVDWYRREQAGAKAIGAYGGMRPVERDALEEIDDTAVGRWAAGQLGVLGEVERAVLLARADGRSVGETADLLGLTRKAVDCAFTRARQKLRLVLSSAMGGLVVILRGSRRILASPTTAVSLAVVNLFVLGALVSKPHSSPVPPAAGAAVTPPRPDAVTVVPVARRAESVPRAAAARRPDAPAAEEGRPGPHMPRRPEDQTIPVVIDEKETPVEHVERCLRNGADIVLTGGRWGVICREDHAAGDKPGESPRGFAPAGTN